MVPTRLIRLIPPPSHRPAAAAAHHLPVLHHHAIRSVPLLSVRQGHGPTGPVIEIPSSFEYTVRDDPKAEYPPVPWHPDATIPHGYTYYPLHKDFPLVPLPPMARVFESQHVVPPLPRQSVFHYLFPPKKKGKTPRFYPAPVPVSLAFIDGLTGQRIYRSEIWQRAMWIASGLGQAGLRREDVACIFGFNSIEWVLSCFAAQARELIVSPVNANYTPTELLHQLRDSGASCIFIAPALLPVLDKALELAGSSYTLQRKKIFLMCPLDKKPPGLPYRCLEEIYAKQAVPRQIAPREAASVAYLCYSSGTTGKAKGVETSHHNITSQVQAYNVASERLNYKDRILGILPFSHIYGLTLLVHQPLTTGAPVVILPRFDEIQVLKAIQDYRITWALIVPPVLITLLNSPHLDKYDLSSLRGVMSGAAPCSAELITAFEAKFPKVRVQTGSDPTTSTEISACSVSQGYGMTECSPVSHVMNSVDGYGHKGTVGKLMPTFQARLVDAETGQDVQGNAPGELWLKGPSVMRGYWKNDEATTNAFAPGGWLKTGDVATVDDEGFFSIVDRVKELIKYKGYQVPPAELEALLLTHPRLVDAGVIGIWSPSQATELPRAYVVPRTPLSSLSPAQRSELEQLVADWIAGKVANHKRLRGGVVLIDAVPKSPSGKILRKDLRELAKKEVEGGAAEGRLAKL